MAAKTLYGALAELVTVVDAVAGVDWAPEQPPEQIGRGPAAVVYASNGQWGKEDGMAAWGVNKGLHAPQIALIMPQGDQAMQSEVLLPMAEPIAQALETHRNGKTSSHYSTFLYITYFFGGVNWNGLTSAGIIFTIHGLKIENTL
jgi:hypothetical protein